MNELIQRMYKRALTYIISLCKTLKVRPRFYEGDSWGCTENSKNFVDRNFGFSIEEEITQQVCIFLF